MHACISCLVFLLIIHILYQYIKIFVARLSICIDDTESTLAKVGSSSGAESRMTHSRSRQNREERAARCEANTLAMMTIRARQSLILLSCFQLQPDCNNIYCPYPLQCATTLTR